MADTKRTMVIGGQARLPKELSENAVLILLAKVDVQTGKIQDVECSPSLDLVHGLFREAALGKKIPDDLEAILSEIDSRLVFKGKKAILTAIKDLSREFQEFKARP